MFLRNLALAGTASFVAAGSRPYGHLVNRQVSTDSSILSGQTFDYVIIGGGTAGLAVANRLSANSSVSVAVIEAGGDGADVMDRILAPTMAYLNGVASPGSPYDWGYTTTLQTGLEDRNVTWPRGKVLGGSSAVNGLYLVRGGKEEHDAWAALNPGSAGTWDWDGLWPYMKASETFTPPSSANVKTMAAVVDTATHGQDGPIHYSYPGYAYEQIGLWSPTFAALGIPSRDGQTGKNYDSFIATSCINPSNWTRSYSKTGYLDPAAGRTNLAVLTGYQATKINFEGKDAGGNATATSVDFAAAAAGTVYNVKARKEVILASGVIGSPQLLQLSGVGDAELLESLDIDVVVDLPGVGAHLKDHLSGRIMFNTSAEVTGDMLAYNTTFNTTQWQAWQDRDANSLYNAPNNAIAYINASVIMGSDYDSWHASIVSSKTKFVTAYSSNPILQAGYKAVYESEMNTIIPGPTGAVEFLLSNSGSHATRNTLGIQAAIQHPLTQGSLKINSTSAFDPPLIDPAYLQHPADVQLFVAALKFIRRLTKTAPLSSIIEGEISPGDDVTSDAALEDFIRGSVGTEYHPAATCSMLPRQKGGVVNTQLQVYGLSNVRVIDSSIVPVPMSAHLMAPTYAIAELGSAIILGTHKVGSSSSNTSNNSSSTSSSSASTSSSTNGSGSGARNAGMRIAPASGLTLLAGVLAVASI